MVNTLEGRPSDGRPLGRRGPHGHRPPSWDVSRELGVHLPKLFEQQDDLDLFAGLLVPERQSPAVLVVGRSEDDALGSGQELVGHAPYRSPRTMLFNQGTGTPPG